LLVVVVMLEFDYFGFLETDFQFYDDRVRGIWA
jgi:hypothetical protein